MAEEKRLDNILQAITITIARRGMQDGKVREECVDASE